MYVVFAVEKSYTAAQKMPSMAKIDLNYNYNRCTVVLLKDNGCCPMELILIKVVCSFHFTGHTMEVGDAVHFIQEIFHISSVDLLFCTHTSET